MENRTEVIIRPNGYFFIMKNFVVAVGSMEGLVFGTKMIVMGNMEKEIVLDIETSEA